MRNAPLKLTAYFCRRALGWVGLQGGIIVELGEKISPIETLGWSWKKARFYGRRNGVVLGILSLLLFLIILITQGALSEMYLLVIHNKELIVALIVLVLFPSLLFGFIGLLFGLVMGGIVGPGIDKEERTIPNQGIRQSAANATIFALIGGLLNVLKGIILGEIDSVNSISSLYNLLHVVLQGALFGALIPGFACILHFSLRAVLCWHGLIPWDYARFLNYATEKMLLQRVGGRYRFIHDLLREHFLPRGNSN